MYGDFFDAPAGMPKSPRIKVKPIRKEVAEEEPQPQRAIKVRFHEEVKVKLVKSRRNPTSLLDLDEDDSDEDMDELPPFEEGWDEEDSEGDDDSEEGSGDSSEGTDDEDEEGFDAIERTKDDLFAEDEAPETGEPSQDVSLKLTYILISRLVYFRTTPASTKEAN